ncbi:extra spindle pole bodies like 1, separase [Arctopsyche grandis]|uniref:extra spindle pole bodies like 1, separase n=1 Tax=Arctopsyche grandis TaxID=121162 RepID=UPI00406D94B1
MSSDVEKTKEQLENILIELKNALKMKSGDPNGPTYQSLRKLNAKCLLNVNKHYEAAYNFVEALAPSVRTVSTYRCDRTYCESEKKNKINISSVKFNKSDVKVKHALESDDLISFLYDKKNRTCFQEMVSDNSVDSASNVLNKTHTKHITDDDAEMLSMKTKLKELPDEWTVVQLTAGYDPREQWETQHVIKTSVKDFYITILKQQFLDLDKEDPFTVKISPKVIHGERPLFDELNSTLDENRNVIENNLKVTNNSTSKYWEKRSDCDERMKSIISAMENKWISGWKCLLVGKIVSKTLIKDIDNYINRICTENSIAVSPLQKMLLKILFSSAHRIGPSEASLMLRKIYMEYSKAKNTGNDLCQKCGKISDKCSDKTVSNDEFKTYRKAFIDALSSVTSERELNGLKNCKRGPVILLMDEKLDTFPWEVLPIFNGSPVTRMECLSVTYALYKEHETNIKNGYFQLKPASGRFLINPGGDLLRMEKRMASFMDYWCPRWEGEKNTLTKSELYEKYLQDSDIFLYCGHGDGSQYMNGGIERLSGIKSVAILSGCGSVSLRPPGTRLLPIPTHSYFHIATCPCVIGMLWEVTDLEIDKVTSMLTSLFVPSTANKAWGDVGKTQWTKGILDLKSGGSRHGNFAWQPDLLKALSTSRRSTSFTMISASIVARGLPVLIHPDYKPV